jgi:hypothetical protein
MYVDCVWNVMAHAQKPDFVFRRTGRVHLNRRGRQFSRLLAAELCESALVMLDTPRSDVVWESTPFAIFPFTSPPVRHCVPSGFKRTLLYRRTTFFNLLFSLNTFYFKVGLLSCCPRILFLLHFILASCNVIISSSLYFSVFYIFFPPTAASPLLLCISRYDRVPHGTTPPVGQDLLIIGASRPHTVTHAEFARHPLDEWSARRRVLYRTTHNNHKREISMLPTGFETAIPEIERPQTHDLKGAAMFTHIILIVC